MSQRNYKNHFKEVATGGDSTIDGDLFGVYYNNKDLKLILGPDQLLFDQTN